MRGRLGGGAAAGSVLCCVLGCVVCCAVLRCVVFVAVGGEVPFSPRPTDQRQPPPHTPHSTQRRRPPKTAPPHSGNYDAFVRSSEERLRNEEKAAESAALRRQHVQAFIDKFRFNAKRASLVQSRIKALERMAEVRSWWGGCGRGGGGREVAQVRGAGPGAASRRPSSA